MRDNPDLDAAFLSDTSLANGSSLPKQRKRPKQAGARDGIRRRAIRCLAVIADLNDAQREAVLKAALRLNRA